MISIGLRPALAAAASALSLLALASSASAAAGVWIEAPPGVANMQLGLNEPYDILVTVHNDTALTVSATVSGPTET